MPAATPVKAEFRFYGADGTLTDEKISVRFNPTEYTLDKRIQIAEHPIPGLDSPVLQFVRGQNETLALELFFDTTANGMGADATAVTTQTDEFYRLVKIHGSTHSPPVCLFTWGEGHFPGGHLPAVLANQQRPNGMKVIVESVRQRFTLFSTNGVPLRATLTLTLREYKSLDAQITELNLRSADQTHAHVVRQDETLASIASEIYGAGDEWRRIADWNAIADPLAVEPGSILEIPPLPAGVRG
jgi:hypothetical protein